ncbi:hypothetical protein TNCV_2998121 [Trichonephila clavipes]|nr:hypothetical protein TNCV_2998121 [Trichonephila clavipes]
MATSTNKTAAFGVKLIHQCMSKHRYIQKNRLFGALYGLVESLVRTSSKTMKARLDYIQGSRGSHMPEIILQM